MSRYPRAQRRPGVHWREPFLLGAAVLIVVAMELGVVAGVFVALSKAWP